MGKKLLLPVSWILAPLVEQLYVFLLDVTSLESLFYHVLVVCKSNQLHVSISESLLCNRETVSVASYTYGFPVAEKAFADANVKLVTLTDYEHVVEEALETGYIKQEDVELLHEWRKDPANWKK